MPAEQQLLRTNHYEQFCSMMAIKSSFFEEEDEFLLIWEDSAAAGRLGNAGGLSFMKIVWLFLFFLEDEVSVQEERRGEERQPSTSTERESWIMFLCPGTLGL